MWWQKYIGIPFEYNKSSMVSCDCAGLIFLVLQQEKKIQISRHNDDNFEAKQKHSLIDKYYNLLNKINKDEVKEFDIFFSSDTEVFHAGFVLNDNKILESTLERGVQLGNVSKLSPNTNFYRLKKNEK